LARLRRQERAFGDKKPTSARRTVAADRPLSLVLSWKGSSIGMTHIALAQPVQSPPLWNVPARVPRNPVSAAPPIETPRLALRSADVSDAGVVELTILLKPNLAEAGWVRFSLAEDSARVVELSFFLAPPYRGRGLMPEAARAAAPRALRLLGAQVFRAILPADAAAAQGVARALGLAAAPGRGATRRFEKDLCGLI
jgi:RimJ/RimL family protein N-acetyltransferase